MDNYTPTTFAEIVWSEVDSKYLKSDFEVTFSSGKPAANLRVIINKDSRVIYYAVIGAEEEGEFEYITEKGAMRWLFREIRMFEFCKGAQVNIPFTIKKEIDKHPSEMQEMVKWADEICSENIAYTDIKKVLEGELLDTSFPIYSSLLASIAEFISGKDRIEADAIVSDMES